MPDRKEGKGMEKKKRQQPMKEMLGLLAVALGWGALTLLVCYGLFLHLHVDYEDLMIWAPLSGVAIFTLALVRGALVRYRTN